MAVPAAGPAVALTLTLAAHLFAAVVRQAVLPLPLARALGFAGLVLDGGGANLGLNRHYQGTPLVLTGCSFSWMLVESAASISATFSSPKLDFTQPTTVALSRSA